ncbi:MAG: DUF348 domain-containing protein [Actinobacteria bacterium]|nr:DUF348 domain-containing protein [Actinomycetota bacterium]
MRANLPPHTLRKLLSLALVALLCAPVVLTTKRVRVMVDGEVEQFRSSFADTVGDVLARRGVEISPADRVTPPPDAPLVDGMGIRVERAIAVRIEAQDGSAWDILTADRTVSGALQAAGLEGAEPVRPALRPLDDGAVIEVRLPMLVLVHVDGGLRSFTTTAATLGEALSRSDLTLGPDDLLEPALSTPVDRTVVARITRIANRTEVEEVVLPFEEVRRETDELLLGTTRVVSEGVEGLRRDTYEVRVVDGEDVERTLASSQVVREPEDRVVEVGTREPPPPPPPPPAPASGSEDRNWYRLAQCESGGNWSYDGTYDGGLQFHPDTWNRWKPAGYPAYAWQASADQQIAVGKRLHAVRGWSPWPSCARKLGLM